MDVRRLLILFCLSVPLSAAAQERITLAEIIPALQETDLGEIDVGAAPAPGMSRVVSRDEVLSALKKAERPTQGLKIPRTSRVTRTARRIGPEEFTQLATPALQEALAPCQAKQIRPPEEVTVSDGPLSVRAEAQPPARSGNAAAVVVIDSGGRAFRVPLRIPVVCPPPAVSPGSSVRIVVRIGNVMASAPGQVRQAGRVQEIVHVIRASDGARMRARVVDSETVEVVDR